jgi:Cu-Zn family superoxide dismutase
MYKNLVWLISLLSGCYAYSDTEVITVRMKETTAPYNEIGTILLQDTDNGLLVETALKNLSSGEHGFHIHEYPSCESDYDSNGTLIPAQKAGGHFDPMGTEKHLGPHEHGHKGDLPALKVQPDGTVKVKFYRPNLTLKEIKNRSLIIHENGDNYMDMPLPLGGGGKRIACGIIR